jgi:hypothetical protein
MSAGPRRSLFREEALRENQRDKPGALLAIPVTWTRWPARFILATVALAAAAAALVDVPRRARGPASVQFDGAMTLVAPAPGWVTSVDVLPGQRVVAGQVCARLRPDGADGATVTRPGAADGVAESLPVIAKVPSLVRAVRARPGERAAEGAPLLDLVPDGATRWVVAALPWRDQALVRVGDRLRVRFGADTVVELALEGRGDAPVLPGALGALFDAADVGGLGAEPRLVVRARWPGAGAALGPGHAELTTGQRRLWRELFARADAR